MAASRPMMPNATVAAFAGKSSPLSESDQLSMLMGTFGSMAPSVRSTAAVISFGERRDRTTKMAEPSLYENGRYATG
jgi:hypothetical protein